MTAHKSVRKDKDTPKKVFCCLCCLTGCLKKCSVPNCNDLCDPGDGRSENSFDFHWREQRGLAKEPTEHHRLMQEQQQRSQKEQEQQDLQKASIAVADKQQCQQVGGETEPRGSYDVAPYYNKPSPLPLAPLHREDQFGEVETNSGSGVYDSISYHGKTPTCPDASLPEIGNGVVDDYNLGIHSDMTLSVRHVHQFRPGETENASGDYAGLDHYATTHLHQELQHTDAQTGPVDCFSGSHYVNTAVIQQTIYRNTGARVRFDDEPYSGEYVNVPRPSCPETSLNSNPFNSDPCHETYSSAGGKGIKSEGLEDQHERTVTTMTRPNHADMNDHNFQTSAHHEDRNAAPDHNRAFGASELGQRQGEVEQPQNMNRVMHGPTDV